MSFKHELVGNYYYAIDLYAQKIGTTQCVRLVNSTYSLQSYFSTNGLGIACTIKSDGGTIYCLFEDNICQTAIYFNPPN